VKEFVSSDDVCAIDAAWSGVKLLIRRESR